MSENETLWESFPYAVKKNSFLNWIINTVSIFLLVILPIGVIVFVLTLSNRLTFWPILVICLLCLVFAAVGAIRKRRERFWCRLYSDRIEIWDAHGETLKKVYKIKEVNQISLSGGYAVYLANIEIITLKETAKYTLVYRQTINGSARFVNSMNSLGFYNFDGRGSIFRRHNKGEVIPPTFQDFKKSMKDVRKYLFRK